MIRLVKLEDIKTLAPYIKNYMMMQILENSGVFKVQKNRLTICMKNKEIYSLLLKKMKK
ncbi:hypothetical protein [Gemella morbillorum]